MLLTLKGLGPGRAFRAQYLYGSDSPQRVWWLDMRMRGTKRSQGPHLPPPHVDPTYPTPVARLRFAFSCMHLLRVFDWQGFSNFSLVHPLRPSQLMQKRSGARTQVERLPRLVGAARRRVIKAGAKDDLVLSWLVHREVGSTKGVQAERCRIWSPFNRLRITRVT